MKPTISIILPCYNVEPYIEDCLMSILNQSFKSYEVLCIEDCSTDNTLHIIQRYVSTYPEKIRLIQQCQNMGIANARNKGIAFSHGAYLCFVDSDDLLKPNALDLMFKAIKQHNADICMANFEFLTNNKIKEHKPAFTKLKLHTSDAFMHLEQLNPAPWAKLYKSSFFVDKINSYPCIPYGEDKLPFIKSLLEAEKIIFIPDAVYQYRIHSTSIMQSINVNRKLKTIPLIYDGVFKYLQKYQAPKSLFLKSLRYIESPKEDILISPYLQSFFDSNGFSKSYLFNHPLMSLPLYLNTFYPYIKSYKNYNGMKRVIKKLQWQFFYRLFVIIKSQLLYSKYSPLMRLFHR